MTKDEFVALVVDKGGMAKADAGHAVEPFCGAVAAAMEKGEAVRLPGFGGFEVQERGERQGRDLRAGEAITTAASKAVKFSADARLKEAVNGKAEGGRRRGRGRLTGRAARPSGASVADCWRPEAARQLLAA